MNNLYIKRYNLNLSDTYKYVGQITDLNENSGFISEIAGEKIYFHKDDLIDSDLQLHEDVVFNKSHIVYFNQTEKWTAVNIQRKGEKNNLTDELRVVGVLKNWDGMNGIIKSLISVKQFAFDFKNRLYFHDSFHVGDLIIFCPFTEKNLTKNKLVVYETALFAYNFENEQDIFFLQTQYDNTGFKILGQYIDSLKEQKNTTENKFSEVLNSINNSSVSSISKIEVAQSVEPYKSFDKDEIKLSLSVDFSKTVINPNSTEHQITDNQIYLNPDDKHINETTEEFYEGIKKTTILNSYERSAKARKQCLNYWKAICAVCNIDFEKVYGEIGKGFIHIHHLTPVSQIGVNYQINPINDLKPVCPNCHSMIHRKDPPLTIDELKMRIKQQQQINA